MPFDGFDPGVEKTLRVLEMMERELQGGRKWARDDMFTVDGKTCLLGVHYVIACGHDDEHQADRALQYLALAIQPASRAKRVPRWIANVIADFNDRCAGYSEIERILHQAQELARADIA
jgi:hypothetical protein